MKLNVTRRTAAWVVLILSQLATSAAFAQPASGGGTQVDWLEVGFAFIAGLCLFLWSVKQLSTALRETSNDRLRAVLHKAGSNRAAGVLSGTAATFVLDSSSATIIILISLVDAGLVGFAATLPMILGSNIGTTLSSQIFALNADAYAPVLMVAGLISSFVKSEPVKKWGEVVFCIGLLLLSLSIMGDAMEPLKEHEWIKEWLRTFENPVLGILAGAAATIAIQSSSAMMGIVIVMASQNLIGLDAGLALMLGAEIGTCADTLIATIGRSAAAVRAGVFHLTFNIVTVTSGAIFLGGLTSLAKLSADEIPQQIANAHVAFNVLGALLFLPLTSLVARLLERVIAGADEKSGASNAIWNGGQKPAS